MKYGADKTIICLCLFGAKPPAVFSKSPYYPIAKLIGKNNIRYDKIPIYLIGNLTTDMHTDRIPYRAFNDKNEYLKDLYSIYEEAYDIPLIETTFTLADVHSFEYCDERSFFVVIVPYTYSKEILVERTFTNNQLGWVLIGGSLRTDINETFIACCKRIASKHILNVELGELEPVAIIANHFTFENRKCTHKGIAFTGRIRNTEPQKALRKTLTSRGKLIPYHETTSLSNLAHNDKVLELAKEYL